MEIIICRFHLTKTWIQLLETYTNFIWLHNKDNYSNIDKRKHYTFSLLFLNLEEVGDCLIEDLLSECPENEKLRKYCAYLTDNYISNENVFLP